MPTSRKKQLAILERRQKVADLALQGWTQSAIARHLGVTQPTVSDDLRIIRREWRESAIRDFDDCVQGELQKLDRVEREAWAAWEKSKEPQQSAVLSGDTGQQQTRRTVKNQSGNPRFLELIQRCSASRRELLGLNAPTKIAPTTPDGKQPFELNHSVDPRLFQEMTYDELETISRIRNRCLEAIEPRRPLVFQLTANDQRGRAIFPAPVLNQVDC